MPISEPATTAAIDVAHLTRQRQFSERTFGPGPRTKGVLDHIRKELGEIEADPSDLREWVDVIILAFDGAWRAGHGPQDILDAVVAKQARNEARTWPDWRTAAPDKAIEHDRSKDAPVTRPKLSCPTCEATTRSGDLKAGRNAINRGDGPEWCDDEWHEQNDVATAHMPAGGAS